MSTGPVERCGAMWRYIARLVEWGRGGRKPTCSRHGQREVRVSSSASKQETSSCLLAWWVIKSRKVPTFLGGRGDSQSFDCGLGVASPSVDTPLTGARRYGRPLSVDACLRGQWGLAERAIERQRKRDSGVETASRRTDHGNPDRSENGTECSASTHHESSTPQQTSAVV